MKKRFFYKRPEAKNRIPSKKFFIFCNMVVLGILAVAIYIAINHIGV